MKPDASCASAFANWRDFYASIAGASATLLGLLFVVVLALNSSVMLDDLVIGGASSCWDLLKEIGDQSSSSH